MVDVRLAPERPDARDPEAGTTATTARNAGGRLARDLTEDATAVDARGLSGDRLAAFVEGVVLGGYRFDLATARTRPSGGPVELCGAADSAALDRGLRAGAGGCWARALANTRSDVKTPHWLADQAVQVLAPLGVEVTVRDEAWLAEHGFGGVLAVGAGSTAPSRLIEARWRPDGATDAPHVMLVGKGITFDTGGINRKPGTAMTTMHTDMAGGAAVLAALRIVAEQQLPVRVTALVPTAENSLSGSAYRPSDVIRHVGGRTSEIGNTDAEGRLVLADAIAYAVAELAPTHLVDIATLTGAMKVALGLRTAGLFATDDALAADLLAAAAAADEPLWRMPMPEEYEDALESPVADANNSPGNPGAITAALFLRPFAGAVPWAHLDIAGPGRAGKDDGWISRGATGFGARLLAQYVAAAAQARAQDS